MNTVNRIVILLPVFLLVIIATLRAQQADSGTILVTVQERMGRVAGVLVRSDNRTATTDANGQARLMLDAGTRTLIVTREGYVTKQIVVTVLANQTTNVTVDVAMEDVMVMDVEGLTVTATRTERLA